RLMSVSPTKPTLPNGERPHATEADALHKIADLLDGPVTDAEAMEHVRALLRYIGENPDREGLLETPRRVIGTLRDHFRGYEEDPSQYLKRTFTEVEGYNELVLVSDIE